MKKIIYLSLSLIIFVCCFSSCELFIIKGEKIIIEDTTIISDFSTSSPIGVVNLFINELKNDNILAATELLAKDDKTLYKAEEKYDISGNVSRIKRFIGNEEITNQEINSTNDTFIINIEIAYIKKAFFEVKEINNKYYITNYSIK